MAISAQFIIDIVSNSLHDVAHTRWKLEDKIAYLNMAIKQILIPVPEANSKYVNLTLMKGAKQTLPSNYFRLLTITRNVVPSSGTHGRSVSMADRAILDGQLAMWNADYSTDEIESYAFDKRITNIFFVYPPPNADNIATVEALVVENPSFININDEIPISDIYTSPIIHWCLYLCLSINQDSQSNYQIAQNHYAAFFTELGVQTASSKASTPNTRESY